MARTSIMEWGPSHRFTNRTRTAYDHPDAAIRSPVDRPLGQPDHVISADATGVSFAEQQMRRGKYYDQPPLPFVPGYDVVGTVTAVGSDVDMALIGRRFAAVIPGT